MSRSLAAPPAVAAATRLVAGRYVDAFALRHLTLTHAAWCRERTAS